MDLLVTVKTTLVCTQDFLPRFYNDRWFFFYFRMKGDFKDLSPELWPLKRKGKKNALEIPKNRCH